MEGFGHTGLLVLKLADLINLKFEFPILYAELFKDVKEQASTALLLKIEAIKQGEKDTHLREGIENNKLRS